MSTATPGTAEYLSAAAGITTIDHDRIRDAAWTVGHPLAASAFSRTWARR